MNIDTRYCDKCDRPLTPPDPNAFTPTYTFFCNRCQADRGTNPKKKQPLDKTELEGREAPASRCLVLTPASDIKPQRVRWLWDGRVALGTLALLAGREGTGKSSLSYWLAALVTRGELPGEYFGQPRVVLVCATEDAWAYTIVPRLMAAGADLVKVMRIEVTTTDGFGAELSLPDDLLDLEAAIASTAAALLILDPLMSRLSASLNSHVDHEVRRALEPITWLAERSGLAVVGIIHHNKSGATDPLQLVMGSKAFTAVARSVHTVIPDPDDEKGERRLFGTPKNNLGRSDLPTLTFSMESWRYETDDGPGYTARIVWGDAFSGTIFDALDRAGADTDGRSAVNEAADWLDDYITKYGPRVTSALIKQDGRRVDHSVDSLKRARPKLGLVVVSEGYPRITYWARQLEQTEQSRSGESLTAPTDLFAPTEPRLEQLEQLEQRIEARHQQLQPPRYYCHRCPLGQTPVANNGDLCDAHAGVGATS